MPKKLIIAISAGAVVVAVAVFAIVLIRSRALTDEAPIGTETPPSDAGGQATGGLGSSAGGGRGTAGTPAVPQAGPCGDGVCSEGEAWCKPDCGSEQERFLGSIVTTDVTATTIAINWKTTKPSTGEVAYGLTDRYELGTVRADAAAAEQAVTLKNLSPGTTYLVRVRATDADGKVWEAEQLAFETPGR
jgi:hypothetical protein